MLSPKKALDNAAAAALLACGAIAFAPGCKLVEKRRAAHCQNMFEAGRKAALQGLPGDFRRHKKLCAKLQISLSEEEYIKGRERGLAELCSFKGGSHYGMRGKRCNIASLCPKALQRDFLRGCADGLFKKLQIDTAAAKAAGFQQGLTQGQLMKKPGP